MSKMSRFRACFDKLYGKCAQALSKSVSQDLYQIHLSLARKLCPKESRLLTCQSWECFLTPCLPTKRILFDKQYAKRAQTLLKYASHYLYLIHWLLPSQLSWKKSLLLRRKILGLLFNTNKKYPVLNKDNLTIPIQIQLSQTERPFSQFFFKVFEYKHHHHRFCLIKVTDSEKIVR